MSASLVLILTLFVTIVRSGDEVDSNYLRCCEEVLQSHPDCTCIVGRINPVSTLSSEVRKIRVKDINFKVDPPITFQVGKNLTLPTHASFGNMMKSWLKGRNPEHFHIYSAPNAVTYRSEQENLMGKMYNPPHPGEMLSELMKGMTITELATHLNVTRNTLSNFINGKAALSIAMAEKLAIAFPCTTPLMWMQWQTQYDLWQLEHNHPEKVAEAVKGVTPNVLKIPSVQDLPLTDDYPRKEFY